MKQDLIHTLSKLADLAQMPVLLVDAHNLSVLRANAKLSAMLNLEAPIGMSMGELLNLGATRSLSEQLADLAQTGARNAETDWLNVLSVNGTALQLRVIEYLATENLALLALRPQESNPVDFSSLDYLDNLFMGFPGHLLFKDAQGRIRSCNDGMAQSFGRSVQDMIGLTDQDYMPAASLNNSRQLDAQAIADRENILAKEQIGQHIYETQRIPVFDKLGGYVGIFILSRDITEHQQLIQALDLRDNLLQVTSRAAQLLLSHNSDQDFDLIVHKVLEMLGATIDVDRVYIWNVYEKPEADNTLYTTQLYEWSPGAEPQQGLDLAVDVPFEDAAPDWVDAFKRGKHVAGLVRDMSLATRAQLEPQGIISILVAPISLQDALWGFIGFDDCHSERVWTEPEINILAAAGTVIGMAINSRRINDKLKDSNENLTKAADEANRANRIKSNFLANMSHEIRTPMNAIMGLTYLAKQNQSHNGTQNSDHTGGHTGDQDLTLDYLDRIHASSRHLLGIIDDILDISRVEAGTVQVDPQPFSLRKLAKSLFSANQIKADRGGLILGLDIAADLPDHLCGDPVRLKQVLNNLVNNAIKFTPQGRVDIAISAASPDAGQAQATTAKDKIELLFEIKDTGIGIAPEDQAQLFTIFQQADNSATRRYGGTGLGLAISAGMVELMGGQIGCDSTPGVGSRFWFSLPLQILDASSPESDASTPDPNADLEQTVFLRGKKLLVVEDNDINQFILSTLLENAGAQTEVAENGKIALDMLAKALADQKPFDLVLMDIQMPEMDGLTATAHIRAKGGQADHGEYYANLPVLAMTAHAMPADFKKSLDAGMNGHVTKPVEPAVLFQAIENWI